MLAGEDTVDRDLAEPRGPATVAHLPWTAEAAGFEADHERGRLAAVQREHLEARRHRRRLRAGDEALDAGCEARRYHRVGHHEVARPRSADVHLGARLILVARHLLGDPGAQAEQQPDERDRQRHADHREHELAPVSAELAAGQRHGSLGGGRVAPRRCLWSAHEPNLQNPWGV